MDTTDDKLHHQSSSFIKQQSTTKFIIKLPAGRKMIQQQQQCKEPEEEVMKKKIKIMPVSKHNLLSLSNSPNSISNNSDSSLFGHMSSHPDRELRGIQSPPSPLDHSQSVSVKVLINEKKKNSPASTDSDDSRKSVEPYQGVGPLPVNWSNTGKRGRRPSYRFFISSDEKIAIKGLLMLKEGNDLDVASMNIQISREETEDITMKKRKKRMILESSSEDVSRSSKKIKIDQERSCGSSRDGFDPKKLISSSNIQSSQLEQLPAAAAASNMFQEDIGLVKNDVLKKVKLADERISCGSSRDVLMNSIPEQLPQVDFSLLKNSSSKKLKLIDDERGCSSTTSRGMFDQGSHWQQMYTNGYVFDSKLLSSIPLSNNHHLEQMSTPNGYFQGGGGGFNSMFPKPAILMKPKKKVKENEKGGSSAAHQNMGMQASCYEFKCDTCDRTFPSHQALGGHKLSQRNCKNSNGSSISYPFDYNLQCRESMLAVEQGYIPETKKSTKSTRPQAQGTHKCELCEESWKTGQALGGHKRAHFKGCRNNSGTVHVNSTTMAQTDQLTVKSAMAQTDQWMAMAQTEKLIKNEEMNRLSVVPVASSSVGEEVISTTSVTKTENKAPVLDFDHNEIDLNETPNEMPDDQSWQQ